MSKIDRNWRIGCENGQQMNMVWAVLKDAGEPMYTGRPHYDEDQQREFRVMVFAKDNWIGGRSESNITFKEFMAIMKPEKENVQYVTNLLDYLDKPELIQHIDGKQVKALHHFPENSENSRILVVYSYGGTNTFSNEGFYTDLDRVNENYNFILKPKPKEYVTGWRRRIICNDGSTIDNLMARPTKEEFMKSYKRAYDASEIRFGPWEKVVTEVCDEL